MEYRSEFDAKYCIFLSVVLLVLAGILTATLLFQNALTWLFSGFLVIVIVYLLWAHLTIRIILDDDVLIVKSGPSRFKVAYEEILSIRPTKDFYTGRRIMTSSNGLAINTRIHALEVKISPQHQESFLRELIERAPQMRVLG